jgi:4-methyl-5(b-hydroxyethyl)-thiazole monophosphate biosynthesis
MKNVYLFLADGFEEIEALATVDVLRRAGVKVTTVSINPTEMVNGAHSIPVVADALFADCSYNEADMLVLPGGMPGAANLDAHEGLRAAISAHAEAGKWLAAICAAPMVYGHMGLLNGKKATCYPGFEGELAGAIYTAAPVEKDGNIITGKGPAVVLPFAYALAEALVGEEVVAQVKAGMLYN